MPCTIAMQFFVQGEHLCCVVNSRSTDVITGLPYDQGFFSFVLELAYKDLVEKGHTGLKLGYCMMKTTFTQLYDSRKSLEAEILAKKEQEITKIEMPKITYAKVVLDDIANGTSFSEIIQWCQENG
jgi:thymidylate synthase